MTVRIVKDYWKNLARHEESIKRSFYHFIKRYPHPEGTEEAYHETIMKLLDLNIFHKFQEAKLVFEDEEIESMKSSGLTDKEIKAKSKALIRKRRINLDKKFDHFLHTWVRQIVTNAYNERDKEARRFTHPGRIDEINSQNYPFRKKHEGYTPWEENEKTKEKTKAFTVGRPYPYISERGSFHSDKGATPEDEYSAKEMQLLLKEMMKNERTKSIIEFKMSGLNGVDIGEILNITPAYVSYILRDLKKRCIKKGLVS